MNRSKVVSLLMIPLFLGACRDNPVERLANPLTGGVVPQSSGIYTIYDDELKTGGGLAFIPGGENQSIDLENQEGERRSTNHIKYVWNGGNIFNSETGEFQHLFAGFNLFITPDQAALATAAPKDLSGPGYTKLTFYIRGSLSHETWLRIQGPALGNEASDDLCVQTGCEELVSISSTWQRVEIPISSSRLSSMKVFVTFSFQYQQPPRTDPAGNGGVIYLDDIRYEL